MDGTGDVVGRLEERIEYLEGQAEHARLTIKDLKAKVADHQASLELARTMAWVSVPIPAHLVMEGDLVQQKDGQLARVLEVEKGPGASGTVKLSLESGPSRMTFTVGPDHPVPVLKRPTHDALAILAAQLGAQGTG